GLWRGGLARGERRGKSQPAGIEDEALLHGTFARNGNAPCQVGAAEGNVHDVAAGLQLQCRGRFAMRGEELQFPVGARLIAKDTPQEALVDVLAVLSEYRQEQALSGSGGGG